VFNFGSGLPFYCFSLLASDQWKDRGNSESMHFVFRTVMAGCKVKSRLEKIALRLSESLFLI
jgi:hypothetical protein